VDFDYKPRPAPRPTEEIVAAMNRIMQPKGVAVIGASAEDGKIGNSVMKNLVNGGYKGEIYPIHPKAAEILGYKAYKSVKDVPGVIDTAVFAIPAKFFAGVSAIVGLGNKSDIDEDDLLAFFEQDPNTAIIAQHCEDLKDGRAFAEAAKRVSRKKPVVVLKAGRTSAGAKAASSHTGALAGNDKIYEDVFMQSGVIRARSLRQLLEFARGVPVLPTPTGENVLIITGAGGSGVLLSDAVVDNALSLMAMPPDLDAAFRKFIPPFGAARNPVDITGGEPPITYVNTVKLGLSDPRIHSLILGYW